MCDVTDVLPSFITQPFSHILPALDRAQISTSDLLTVDAGDLARRANVPSKEIRRISDAVLESLHQWQPKSLKCSTPESSEDQGHVSFLDSAIDQAVHPIPAGYVTEITGESGAGKTQLLLTLLLAAQLPAPSGLGRRSIYISTEAPLQTKRLAQLLQQHPRLAGLPAATQPSLADVLSITCRDLQTQEHILRYQLPVAIKKHNVGLVVVDSITANFRAELDKKSGHGFAARSTLLQDLGAHLRQLAQQHRCAVVVANQVADRFERPHLTRGVHSSPPQSSYASQSNDEDEDTPLSLEHQQRWFTGWGDGALESSDSADYSKTPSLGLVWSSQISCRIAVIKSGTAQGHSRRYVKVVFAPWTADHAGTLGCEFTISSSGVTAISAHEK